MKLGSDTVAKHVLLQQQMPPIATFSGSASSPWDARLCGQVNDDAKTTIAFFFAHYL
jgi:hypothetical protein